MANTEYSSSILSLLRPCENFQHRPMNTIHTRQHTNTHTHTHTHTQRYSPRKNRVHFCLNAQKYPQRNDHRRKSSSRSALNAGIETNSAVPNGGGEELLCYSKCRCVRVRITWSWHFRQPASAALNLCIY